MLRRITKITIFSSHPGKNENCRQNNDRPPPLSLSNAVYSNMRIIQVDLDQKGIKKGGGGVLVFCLQEMVAWRKSRIWQNCLNIIFLSL